MRMCWFLSLRIFRGRSDVGPNAMIEQVVNAMGARLFYAGYLAQHVARKTQ